MNKKAILVISTVATFLFYSCRSDVLRDKRIDGTWKVDQYLIGSSVLLPVNNQFQITNVTYEFDKDGDFTQTISGFGYYGQSNISFTGNWENNDGDLELNFDANSQGVLSTGYGSSFNNYYCESYYNLREEFDIIKLKGDDLEMETTINGIKVSIKATKQ